MRSLRSGIFGFCAATSGAQGSWRIDTRRPEQGGATVLGRIISPEEHLARLNRIGIAFTTERDLDRLLAAILQEARRFARRKWGQSAFSH
jgi:hypothetical protein